MAEPKLVSIIVPVYNAADTLHIALNALLKQTYPAIELIFVNDCSTDESLAIVQKAERSFLEKGFRVEIVSHTRNEGVAAARNTGLDRATGGYIYYVDADDAIEAHAVEGLVQEAIARQADIVGCNWYLTFAKNERKMNQPAFSDPWDAIQKMLSGTMRWNLWLFLVRRSLYEENNIRFIPGKNMGEDLMVMVKLFALAQQVAYVDKPLYHYGQSNTASLTKTYSPRHMEEVSANIAEVERFLERSPYRGRIGGLMPFLKLNIKLPLLISSQTGNYRQWKNWFPEANRYALANKALSLRIRLLQWAAAKGHYWLLRMHYYLVIRLVYGIIYR